MDSFANNLLRQFSYHQHTQFSQFSTLGLLPVESSWIFGRHSILYPISHSLIFSQPMFEKRRCIKSSDAGVEVVRKPAVIEEYNRHMGGVDRADQLVTYYGYPHFSKWWKECSFTYWTLNW